MSTTYESLLVDATRWHDGSRTISYSFLATPASYYARTDIDEDGVDDGYLVDGYELAVPYGADTTVSGELKAQTLFALQAWNDVANVNIVAAAAGKIGDIAIGAAQFGDESLYGFVSDFPGGRGKPSPTGDLWLNLDNPRQAEPAFGSDGMSTLVHELGHALGLHHPDEDPNNEAGDPRNNNQWTVLSYEAHPGVDASDDNGAYPVTPMVLDIQAIQSLYGANLDTRNGRTTYLSGAGAEFAIGNGGRFASGIQSLFTIWDAGGVDTLNAANQSGAVSIDLTPGSYSTVGALKNNIGLAAAVEVGGKVVNYVENAYGGRASDIIVGNDANNLIKGNGGHDRFDLSGLGADRVEGGSGNDRADWGAAFTAKDRFDGGSGKDVLELGGNYWDGLVFTSASVRNVETILLGAKFDYDLGMHDGNLAAGKLLTLDASALGNRDQVQFDGTLESDGRFHLLGGRSSDALFGGDGNDTIVGGRGNDTLYGSSGADVLTGGGGRDVFEFEAAAESRRGTADRILDFEDGRDRIDLSVIDANSGRSGNQAFHFGGGGGHAGDIVARYDARAGGTVLDLYTNAGSSVDMRIVLAGNQLDVLGAADFIL